MSPDLLRGCDEVMTAVVNGTGQGLVLVGLVGLVLRWAGRTNAATRHATWLVTLVLLAGLIPLDYWRHHAIGNGPTQADTRSRPRTAGARDRATGPTLRSVPPQSDALLASPAVEAMTPDLTGERTARGAPVSAARVGPAVPAARPLWAPGRHGARGTARPTLTSLGDFGAAKRRDEVTLKAIDAGPGLRPNPAASTPARPGSASAADPAWRALAWSAKIPRGASVACLVLWAIVGGFRVSILFARLARLRRLKQSAEPAEAGVDELFRRLRAELGGRRNVVLRVCAHQRSPVTLGYLHPVILLPEEQLQGPGLSEAEPILRHELAHVRRRDDWANLAQHLVHAGLFFHPAVWWVTQQLSLEREIACDDCVLPHGGGPQRYALLLAELAGRMNGHGTTLAPGATSNKSQLQQRITMILNRHRNTSPRLVKTRLGALTSAALLVALLTTYCAPRVVLAQPQPAPSGDAAPNTPPGVVASTPTALPGMAATVLAASDTQPTATRGPATSSSVATSVLAVNDPPPAATPADVDPGPKSKPSPGDALAALPAAPATPAPDVAPAPPSAIPAPPEPQPQPEVRVMKPRGPRKLAPLPKDASIEERLDRVEKMVEAILAQQGARAGRPPGPMPQPLDPFRLKERMDREAARAADQGARAARQAADLALRLRLGVEQNKWAALAEADATRAQADAKRAEADAKRDEADAKRAQADAGRPEEGMRREALQKAIEGLHREREALGREMENLGREIERLQREQERVDALSGQRNDAGAQPPAPETPR